MNYYKTVISFKEQAKQRLDASFSGKQNKLAAAFKEIG